jgi:hypothetical protein
LLDARGEDEEDFLNESLPLLTTTTTTNQRSQRGMRTIEDSTSIIIYTPSSPSPSSSVINETSTNFHTNENVAGLSPNPSIKLTIN